MLADRRPKRRDNTLLDALADAFVVDDLEVLVTSGFLDATEHGIVSVAAKPARTLRIIADDHSLSSAFTTLSQNYPNYLWHYISDSTPSPPLEN